MLTRREVVEECRCHIVGRLMSQGCTFIDFFSFFSFFIYSSLWGSIFHIYRWIVHWQRVEIKNVNFLLFISSALYNIFFYRQATYFLWCLTFSLSFSILSSTLYDIFINFLTYARTSLMHGDINFSHSLKLAFFLN